MAAVSEQAANILDYLKNKLAPVNPLTGLDQLSEHVTAMLKGSQRQINSEEKQVA